MVDMVLGEDTPGYRARGGPLGVPVAWVSLLPRRGRMAEGHVARPLEKKEGRMAMEGRSPRRRGGWVGCVILDDARYYVVSMSWVDVSTIGSFIICSYDTENLFPESSLVSPSAGFSSEAIFSG